MLSSPIPFIKRANRFLETRTIQESHWDEVGFKNISSDKKKKEKTQNEIVILSLN